MRFAIIHINTIQHLNSAHFSLNLEALNMHNACARTNGLCIWWMNDDVHCFGSISKILLEILNIYFNTIEFEWKKYFHKQTLYLSKQYYSSIIHRRFFFYLYMRFNTANTEYSEVTRYFSLKAIKKLRFVFADWDLVFIKLTGTRVFPLK